ncbi:hypothetical protein NEOLEDRAFT_1075397 [Neolentinus lepideus HHB14362 ss-1]|uniref:Ribosome assembly protein 3 n=1 Tax=Neolentinus lepideus HHB14362 ss-1 TaxID=1314782 RepID=A0A165P6B7_9AGAM|nr:hypothetical protein NEOLEDRAFT_1075397 [Neolentinus lepideus HHB14362 ss-1]
MPPAKPVQQRKRNRKRKRRAASSSESSSESSSDESSTPQVATKVQTTEKEKPVSDESDESSSSSDSESESEAEQPRVEAGVREADAPKANSSQKAPPRQRSLSVSPPPATIPPFPPTSGVPGQESSDEQALKEKFRKFWMSSIADGFKDDLDVIRKEPNMTSSRLGLLIESLAAGTDVFSSSPDKDRINEMEVVLDQPKSIP